MKTTLVAVPRKLKHIPPPGLDRFSYSEQLRIAEPMAAQDPRFVFYSLRVMNDELWNMIDGRHSVGAIAKAVCMEFGFELDPALFLPLFDGLVRSGLITLDDTED